MTEKNYSHKANRPYFEGWYFKCRTQDGKTIALIPAIHKDSSNKGSASLQIIAEAGTWWLEYPEVEFHAAKQPLRISLGPNTFSEEGISLQVERNGLSLRGNLRHGPFTLLRSDIMGPFRFFPEMECAHGVVSMGHHLDGALTLNGETLDFSGGLGYIETDRGRSFPDQYLWTQCSWAKPQNTGLMLAVATIPIRKHVRFTGIICSINYNNREYRLATYKGARIKAWSEHRAEVVQGKYRLLVEVLAKQGQPLRAPVEGAMGRVIHESLCAKVRYRFWEKERLFFDHADNGASFEYADRTIAPGTDSDGNTE